MPPERPGVADESAGDPEDRVDVLAELAEAEAAEARALAEAEEAGARAEQLRGTDRPEEATSRALLPKIAPALAGLVAGACVVTTGVMLWQHAGAAAQRSHDEQIVEGARAGVTALLSIDHTRARADVQRVLDVSTGTFREDFAKTADDFVATAESQKVVTVAKIKAAALESAEPDGGVVLVAVNSEVTNAAGAKEDARPFRMSVTVARDGGQFKMSSLEFVP